MNKLLTMACVLAPLLGGTALADEPMQVQCKPRKQSMNLPPPKSRAHLEREAMAQYSQTPPMEPPFRALIEQAAAHSRSVEAQNAEVCSIQEVKPSKADAARAAGRQPGRPKPSTARWAGPR